MKHLVPTKIFFTKGVGTHKDELHSFERALRDADIEMFNLVQVEYLPATLQNGLKNPGTERNGAWWIDLLCLEPLLQ